MSWKQPKRKSSLLWYYYHFILNIYYLIPNLTALTIVQKGLNTDSNSWTQEAVFEGMSKYEKKQI